MSRTIRIRQKGDYQRTTRFLERSRKMHGIMDILTKYAEKGVVALSNDTPVDTGETASSWYYEVKVDRSGSIIEWKNRNVENGVLIAIILQYGHANQNGSYFEGYDYINPAIQPIMNEIRDNLWEEVKRY